MTDHAHDHDHDHDHGRPPPRETPPGVRPAEGGGPACQLDLALLLPGEHGADGRFARLEQVLTARRGIAAVHLREDLERPEVCVHYDPAQVTLGQVLALVRGAGAEVAKRYQEKAWAVRGMDCAQCAAVIEHSLQRLDGVLSARVAYSTARLVVEYDGKATGPRAIETRARALGFELETTEQGHTHGTGPDLEMPLVIASGVLLAAGYAADKLAVGGASVPTALYVLAAIAGGFYTVRDAFNALRARRYDIETLMVLAAVGAGAVGAWFEGALLLFLFSLGHALEHRAMERTRRAVEALGKLRPESARVRRDGEVVEVPVASVEVGARVVVRPGDRVPLDGVIREGRSALDQAAITGESVPASKGPGDTVFAGTINTEAALEVEVTKRATDSALARVMALVAEAEAQKSPTQRFTQKFEQRFVPVVLLGAPALAAVRVAQGAGVREALLQAMAVLVAASPCALAIATPAAVLSAVARAARGGVLIKGGAHLETLGKVAAMAFDKTGTLTEGKPRLVSVAPAPGVDEATLLGTAAGPEALSAHPLARAVVDGARERGATPSEATGLEAVHGKGLRATVEGEAVAIGNLALFDGEAVPEGVKADVGRLEVAGQTTMVVRRGERFLGVLGVADTVRPGARGALAALAALGVRRTVMLSGDNRRVAEAIAGSVGITEARAPLMPEGKVAALKELAREGGVAMVGDGVNDAPALAAASVGVAMGGAGSDAALETADVVLMSDDLRRLPFAVGLARSATRVIRQNLAISLGVSAALIVAAVAGWARISHAVVLHEGSTLLVVANALRLLAWRDRAPAGAP